MKKLNQQQKTIFSVFMWLFLQPTLFAHGQSHEPLFSDQSSLLDPWSPNYKYDNYNPEQEEDELDPNPVSNPNWESDLKKADIFYEFDENTLPVERMSEESSCIQWNCPLFANIVKSEQKLYLYENQKLIQNWLVSTGAPGRETPLFDLHPDGRIYKKYTSRKFPGGNYRGLGNMPFAVFLQGGYAIHGTASISKLGSKASHGCIRLHPEHAHVFNQLTVKHSVRNVWVSITEKRMEQPKDQSTPSMPDRG